MNMFANFDEIPAMTLQEIKETKRYGRKHTRKDNMKTAYPPQTKFAGGIIIIWTNSIGPTSLMLHTKSQGHGTSGSREDF